jgi:chaperonin cofactor prefoldin
MRIATDETVRDLTVWFMLMSSRNFGEDSWSRVFVIVESPTTHTLSTEVYAELPPLIGVSSTKTVTFSELASNSMRDGIVDITLPKDLDSGPVWGTIAARWKVNRGWWIIENWQEKCVPYQSSMTLVTYIGNMSEELEQLQQNYNSLQSNYTTLQSSYQTLQTNYQTLQSTYTALQTSYQTLQSTYTALQNLYDLLEDNYKTLQNDYNEQTTAYGNLSEKFNDIKDSHEALNIQNTCLNTSFNILQTSYQTLQTNYQALQSERAQQTTLTIVIAVVVAMVSIILTIFVCRRKKQ